MTTIEERIAKAICYVYPPLPDPDELTARVGGFMGFLLVNDGLLLACYGNGQPLTNEELSLHWMLGTEPVVNVRHTENLAELPELLRQALTELDFARRRLDEMRQMVEAQDRVLGRILGITHAEDDPGYQDLLTALGHSCDEC